MEGVPDMSDILTRNFGTGPIEIKGPATELRPTELYLKENGAIGDTASFAIVLTDPFMPSTRVFGQLTLVMLNEALNELGYRVVKINKNIKA
jgi:hypothetical protein